MRQWRSKYKNFNFKDFYFTFSTPNYENHKMKKNLVFISVFICLSTILIAQNPIIKDIGMSDPHIRIFNDTIYLYTGHDSHPDDKTWVMKNWRVFSSVNLVDWELREIISPEDNYMDDNSTDCWAADAAMRNGKYYFYFSDRKRGIGVMTANSPTGPFKDALGKPLVSPMHDPTILTDNDPAKMPYLVYGDKEGGGFHIARLNNDMISLAEKPKPIQIIGEEWENAPLWMDKNYIFKHNETYYLSWGRDYAKSDNIYGPYQSAGAVGFGHHLSEFAHGSFFNWKGQFYHIWCYYIRPGYRYRESIITYCHIDDEGSIVTDTGFLDQHFSYGVGRYNAEWAKIEAELFYNKSPEIVKKGTRNKGFTLTNIKNKSWIAFNNVNFSGDEKTVTVHAKSVQNDGKIEIRAGSARGKLLCTLNFKQHSGFQTIKEKLIKTTGEKNIYLVFTGKANDNMSLDWLSFSGN